MAQTTSQLWKQLIRDRNTRREYMFEINAVPYGEDAEISHRVSGGLYEKFGIGNAAAATLNLVIEAPDVPRGAEIRRYVRLVLEEQTTEWLPKGVFYTNRRSESEGIWTVEAFDALRKAAVPYVLEGEQEQWPQPVTAVVASIIKRMGVELDERTVLDESILVGHPGTRTMQTVLCHIAAAHAGNWIMTDAGKLRLVPLISAPPETSYLVDQNGDCITLGGVRILV